MEGEKSRQEVKARLYSLSLPVEDKFIALHSEVLPVIHLIQRKGKWLEFDFKCQDMPYRLRILPLIDEIVSSTLAQLYGYGNIRYNYKLDTFEILTEEMMRQYQRLAVEVWDRNIHQDWMRSCGYPTHNGTKDERFLIGLSSNNQDERREAITLHNVRTDQQEKGDTPNHAFRDIGVLREIVEREGHHHMHQHLIESFQDQASAPGRWYREGKPDMKKMIEDNIDAGYFISQSVPRLWKPGVFGFTNRYEQKLWNEWQEANDKFLQYWTTQFGLKSELWQPPLPPEALGNL